MNVMLNNEIDKKKSQWEKEKKNSSQPVKLTVWVIRLK
jgi:hypothetical protein